MRAELRASRRYALLFFLMFGIYGVISPYLQIMLRNLGYSTAAVGAYLGYFEIAGLTGSIFIARAADAAGRYRGTLSGSAAAIIIGLFLLALWPRPAATFIAVSLVSLGTKTIIPLLDAAFTTASERRRLADGRGFEYGPVRGLGSAGFIVFVLAMQILPGVGSGNPFAIAAYAAIPALGFIAVSRGLPVLVGQDRPPGTRGAEAPGYRRGAEARVNRLSGDYLIGLGIIALGRFALSAYTSFFSLYLEEELRWKSIGLMWAISAMAEIPVMFAAKRIMSNIDPLSAIAISSGGVAVRLAIMALFPTPAGAVTGQLLHSVAFGLFQPAGIAFVSRYYPPNERATGLTLYSALGVGLPMFAGSLLGGFIAEAAGYRILFASFVPFALASVALYRYHAKRSRVSSAT